MVTMVLTGMPSGVTPSEGGREGGEERRRGREEERGKGGEKGKRVGGMLVSLILGTASFTIFYTNSCSTLSL